MWITGEYVNVNTWQRVRGFKSAEASEMKFRMAVQQCTAIKSATRPINQDNQSFNDKECVRKS